MTEIYIRRKRKKGKHPRWNHKDYHLARKNKKRRKKIKKSGWKLQYPKLFELIEVIPYIRRREK